MSKRVVSYTHHGREVRVREDLKGRHWEFCLCHRCAKLNLEDRSQNCRIASLLYALDVTLDLVTPVWECPEFEALPE